MFFSANRYSQIDGKKCALHLNEWLDGVEPADLNQCFEQCDNMENCDGFNYYPPSASTQNVLRCTFWSGCTEDDLITDGVPERVAYMICKYFLKSKDIQL